LKLSKSTKKFVLRWASYPLRSLMYRHAKKIILLLLAVIAGLLVLMLQPQAADVTVPEMETEALNQIAAAISQNAQVLEDFMDTMDVSEVSEMASNVNGLLNAGMAGIPGIVIAVVVFVLAFIVFRKVIGR